MGEAELMIPMNREQQIMFKKLMNKIRKRKKIQLILGFFLGYLGGHRYYIGDYLIGAIYTGIGLIAYHQSESFLAFIMIGAWIDSCLLMNRIDKYNHTNAVQIANKVSTSENPVIDHALEKASEYALDNDFESAVKELKSVYSLTNCDISLVFKEKLNEYQNNFDRQQLYNAIEEATLTNFEKAIIRLKKIEACSNFYEEAQIKIAEYEEEFKKQQIEREIQEKEKREKKAYQLFETGVKTAEAGLLSPALISLKLIQKNTKIYEEAQIKIAEYEEALKHKKLAQEKAKQEKEEELKLKKQKQEQEKQEKLADQLLKNAAIFANQENYSQAIQVLNTISHHLQAYQTAKLHIDQYKKNQENLEKQRKELIKNLPNVICIIHKGKPVAAAFIDQTLYVIDSLERKNTINGIMGDCTTTSGDFIISHLIVRNDSPKTRSISASQIVLLDDKNREFSVSSEGMSALVMSGDKTAELVFTEIQPGLEKYISIVFEIPLNSKDFQLKIPGGGLFSQPTILPLSIAV
ncbi:TM2 domain-containing protein [Crocosphaera watsonii]|uniref:TM2 domain-containing protein n=1 Tax=Crocosphaera watsonii TaxID=263511 RepID=UPI000039C9AC|nr:TM2 domain-containing protein [Crocosphaera watsonii]